MSQMSYNQNEKLMIAKPVCYGKFRKMMDLVYSPEMFPWK